MKKRILSLFIIVSMMAVMIAGCGSGGETSGGVEGDPSVEKWPKEDVTVTWWLVGGTDTYYQTYWTEMKSMKAIQASVGINIDFQVAQNYDSYLPMMAANNYADIVTGLNLSKYPGRMAGMYKDNVSVDLRPYMDEYMPNFKKILEDYPDLARDIRLDDGAAAYGSG